MTKKLTLRVLGDTKDARKELAALEGGVGRFAGALGGVGGKKNVWGGMAIAMSGSGLLEQFGLIQQGFDAVSQSYDQLDRRAKHKINIGATMTGVGVGTSLAAGALDQLASPLEAAHAQLSQSIANVGENADSLKGPIAATEKHMQSLGFTFTDTEGALSKLTPALGSGEVAIKNMGLVSDIAARNHESLSAASDQVIKAFARSPQVLKTYGINLTDITGKGKAAVAAQKAHAKAQDELVKAQQRLSQLEARLGASGTAQDSKAASKRQANAAAVVSAQDQVAAAGQHLQEVEAKLRSGAVAPATAQAELLAAQNRLAAAQARLNAATARSVSVTGLSVSQQQELANAQQAVNEAQAKVASTGITATKTQGDLNKSQLTGQQVLDLLHKRTNGLAEAQSKTFGGDLRKWKADVIDFGATFGEHYAKPLTAIGPVLTLSGSLINSGFFGKIGRGAVSAAKGIGSLTSKAGQLLGLVSKTPSIAPEKKAGEKAAGETTAGGSGGGLGTAAEKLSAAAQQLSEAAMKLSGAATQESGAATALDGSATGLDGSSTAIEGSATGLDGAGTALEASATASDASAVALDGSATALDGSATALEAGGAMGGGGAGGGSRLAQGTLVLTAGITAYQGTNMLLHHTPLGSAVKSASTSVANFLGVGPQQTYDQNIGKGLVAGNNGEVSMLEQWAAAPASARFGQGKDISPSDAKKMLHNMGIKGYGAGGLVSARSGGTLALLAEAGQDEIVGTPHTIVQALEAALHLGGPGGRRGPDVAHYHDPEIHIAQMTVQANNPDDFMRSMRATIRRANFAGHGPAGIGLGSD